MKDRILEKLSEIEQDKGIKILFAVESGSRAWGFASPDSDYDIRFVYKQDLEAYLSLWEGKDTIEFMTEDDLDGSGWDLKKATTLLSKTNASFLGWLFSPEVYLDKGETLKKMKALAERNFNPIAGFHHYNSMNKGFYDQLDNDDLSIKSFFYAMRTALCANWIMKFGSIPPVLFTELYPLVDSQTSEALDALIVRKSSADEKEVLQIPDFLKKNLKEIVDENESRKDRLTPGKVDYSDFNSFFLKQLR